MKLTCDNFLSWETQVLPSVCGARVMGLLEGRDLAPSEFLDAKDDKGQKISVPNWSYDSMGLEGSTGAWFARQFSF
jgi:hypothetical protein